jgi:hypothetical protein
MQHGQTRAAHPDGLPRRGDLDWRAGQHGDRITVADAGGSQATRDPTRPLVHLTPVVPDGAVRLSGNHAVRTGLGGAIHLLGESAQDRSLGSGATAPWSAADGEPGAATVNAVA